MSVGRNFQQIMTDDHLPVVAFTDRHFLVHLAGSDVGQHDRTAIRALAGDGARAGS